MDDKLKKWIEQKSIIRIPDYQHKLEQIMLDNIDDINNTEDSQIYSFFDSLQYIENKYVRYLLINGIFEEEFRLEYLLEFISVNDLMLSEESYIRFLYEMESEELDNIKLSILSDLRNTTHNNRNTLIEYMDNFTGVSYDIDILPNIFNIEGFTGVSKYMYIPNINMIRNKPGDSYKTFRHGVLGYNSIIEDFVTFIEDNNSTQGNKKINIDVLFNFTSDVLGYLLQTKNMELNISPEFSQTESYETIKDDTTITSLLYNPSTKPRFSTNNEHDTFLKNLLLNREGYFDLTNFKISDIVESLYKMNISLTEYISEMTSNLAELNMSNIRPIDINNMLNIIVLNDYLGTSDDDINIKKIIKSIKDYRVDIDILRDLLMDHIIPLMDKRTDFTSIVNMKGW